MIAKDTVCVIIAYWPERADNIAHICADVLAGSEVPSKIIVFNNNPTWKLRDRPEEIFKDHRIALIDSDTNFTSRSKYSVALLEPSQYYLLLDDDISVHPGLLARFRKFAKPGCCFSNLGANFVDNHASSGSLVKAVELAPDQEPQKVDIFIGIVQFVSFEAIVKMLSVEAKVRLPNLPEYRSVGEDMLIAQAQGPGGAHIVSVHEYDAPKSMPLGSESMQDDWGYYMIRDKFSFNVREFTGHHIWPDKEVPGSEDYDQKAIRIYNEVVAERENKYGK